MLLLKLSKETDFRTECLNELGKRQEQDTLFRGVAALSHPCPSDVPAANMEVPVALVPCLKHFGFLKFFF